MPRIYRNLAMVIVLLTVATIPSSAHAATGACANQTGADVVTTRNTSCSEARKLIRLWVQGVRRDRRFNRNVAKWSCRNRPSSVEGDTMICRKGSRQRVSWYVNLAL